MWGWNGWSWWGGLLMMFSMVAFSGLLIWGIVALFRRPCDGRQKRPDPEGILAERFAAGEINKEEYRRRLETLRSSGSQSAGSRRGIS
jgi:putative membrane protein